MDVRKQLYAHTKDKTHIRFKVSIYGENPRIGLFSKQVLGLICLWSTGAQEHQ